MRARYGRECTAVIGKVGRFATSGKHGREWERKKEGDRERCIWGRMERENENNNPGLNWRMTQSEYLL